MGVEERHRGRDGGEGGGPGLLVTCEGSIMNLQSNKNDSEGRE